MTCIPPRNPFTFANQVMDMYPDEKETVRDQIMEVLNKKNRLNSEKREELDEVGEEIVVAKKALEIGKDGFDFDDTSGESHNSSSDAASGAVKTLPKRIKRSSSFGNDIGGISKGARFTASSANIYKVSPSEDDKTSSGTKTWLPRKKPEAAVQREALSQEEFQIMFSGSKRHYARVIVGAICLYNILIIPVRIALLFSDFMILDYVLDALLWVDSYCNWTFWPAMAKGVMLVDPEDIRRDYMSRDFYIDLLARFPYELIILIVIPLAPNADISLVLSFLRLPKFFLILKAREYFTSFETIASEFHLPFTYLRIAEV